MWSETNSAGRILRNLSTSYNIDSFVDKVVAKDLYNKISKKWTPLQRETMWRWIVNGETHKDIAKDWGVSKQAVKHRCDKAIEKAQKLARRTAFTDSAL
jgi:FixJ family two-component response regulator